MSEDRREITGYTFLTDGEAVSWFSKKQEIIPLSSEYVAATHDMKSYGSKTCSPRSSSPSPTR